MRQATQLQKRRYTILFTTSRTHKDIYVRTEKARGEKERDVLRIHLRTASCALSLSLSRFHIFLYFAATRRRRGHFLFEKLIGFLPLSSFLCVLACSFERNEIVSLSLPPLTSLTCSSTDLSLSLSPPVMHAGTSFVLACFLSLFLWGRFWFLETGKEGRKEGRRRRKRSKQEESELSFYYFLSISPTFYS